YLPLAVIIAGILLLEMIVITSAVISGGVAADATVPVAATLQASNIETIGRVLYTDYVYFFQAAGIVLLIAMIGAIVLTLRHKPGVRRQNIHDQVTRDAKTAIEIKGAVTGAGVTPEELL
ncbi:MAG TPA: NADH-quinone oxidoreductase subunit J, partial [Brevundimonas sp.]